jgi:hypothetical protein
MPGGLKYVCLAFSHKRRNQAVNMKMSEWKFVLVTVALISLGLGEERTVAVTAGPRVEFDSTILNFGKAVAGQVIEHDFIFTNTGDQTLEIRDVRPTCGCTVAGAWNHSLEPGKSGIIPMRFTSEYKDKDVFKTVIVDTNDPHQTNVILQIIGTVWETIDVSPAFVMFGASSDCTTNQTRVVHIVNNLDESLILSDLKCMDDSLKTAVQTIQAGKEFELQITLPPPLKPGSKTIPISLKTSSSNLPVINITAFVTVEHIITSTPPQIILSAGPLSANVQVKVMIQNNGTEMTVLSKPSINIKGVDVQLNEVQAGRQFILTAIFPAGLKIPAGKNVQVQIKTDNSKFPIVTVPVIQNQRLSQTIQP